MCRQNCNIYVKVLWSLPSDKVMYVCPTDGTYNILHFCTELDTVAEHTGQGDGVGETQPHQTGVQGYRGGVEDKQRGERDDSRSSVLRAAGWR